MSNGITRFNPIREMATMQNMMDRLFEDWRPFINDSGTTTNALALDVHEDDQSYIISTELPGVKPDDLHVRQEGDISSLKVKREMRARLKGRKAIAPSSGNAAMDATAVAYVFRRISTSTGLTPPIRMACSS